MTTDLTMLVYTALLTLVLSLPGALALIMAKGVPFAAGNRDEAYELPLWGQRAKRAHANAVENLPVFAALVLAVHVSGSATDATAFAASLFFFSRVGHAVLYIAGVPYLRTLAFFVSAVALIQLVGAMM